MTDSPEITPPAAPQRPAEIPEKFWDPQAGQVRTEALAKSYLELERHTAGMVRLPAEGAAPEELAAFHRALGVPEAPDGYQIAAKDEMIGADPEVNARLHAAGFTPAQAQLVYDLAAERLLPMVHTLAADFEADRQMEKLERHFGGTEKWAETSRQLGAWAKANLPPAITEALSGTYEGVLALHRLMQSGEPPLGKADPQAAGPSEAELKQLMRDPRYWRDRDPLVVQKVAEGFARLYPGEG